MKPARRTIMATLALCACLAGTAAAMQTGETPQDAAAADFNGDGRIDMAVVHAFDGMAAILLQQPDGSFQVDQQHPMGIASPAWLNAPRQILAEDFNRDGAPDLLVLCSGNFAFGTKPSLHVLMNRGDGTMVPLTPYEFTGALIGDLFAVHAATGRWTPSGVTDLAVALLRDRSVLILAGDGAGNFQWHQRIPLDIDGDGPEYLLQGDIDRDGLDDLIAVTESGAVILRQTAPGTFAPPVSINLPAGPKLLRSACIEDMNGDGHLDLVLADATGRVFILGNLRIDGTADTTESIVDPSFIEPAHVVPTWFDSSPVPGLAVANLGGADVTLVAPGGGTSTVATGLQPRRIVTGDFSGDGLLDLVVVNQGDFVVPANSDVTLIPNPAECLDCPILDSTVVAEAFGLRLRHARLLAAASPSRVWVLEQDRQSIQELNPSPALNSNPSAKKGLRIVFPFEVGGLSFVSQNEGYVVERDAGRIHRFLTASGIAETIAFADTPGPLGYTGLTRDGATGQFFVADYARRLVLRIGSSGTVLGSFPVDRAPGDLAWESTAGVLAVATPGRSDLAVYTPAGTLVYTFGTSGAGRLFAEAGVVGVSRVANAAAYYLLTDSGMLVQASTTGVPSGLNTVSPAADSLGIAHDSAMGWLYILGKDGHVAIARKADLSNGRLVSMWPAVQADPQFLPGGIAHDTGTNQILVSDATRPVVARFSVGGSFQSFDTWTLASPAHVAGGFARQRTTGHPWFRHPFSAENGQTGVIVPLSSATSVDMAATDELMISLRRNPREILVTPLDSGESAYPVWISNGAAISGAAFDASDSLVLHGSAGEGVVITVPVIPGPDTAVEDWMLLDDGGAR